MIEKHLVSKRVELEMLDKQLADGALYTDPERKEELSRLVKQQGEIKASIETSEWEWQEASEALEKK